MDIVITTCVHGALLALRNRVPVVALDAVSPSGDVDDHLARIAAIGEPSLATYHDAPAERVGGRTARR
jgi:hypothetical protein